MVDKSNDLYKFKQVISIRVWNFDRECLINKKVSESCISVMNEEQFCFKNHCTSSFTLSTCLLSLQLSISLYFQYYLHDLKLLRVAYQAVFLLLPLLCLFCHLHQKSALVFEVLLFSCLFQPIFFQHIALKLVFKLHSPFQSMELKHAKTPFIKAFR